MNMIMLSIVLLAIGIIFAIQEFGTKEEEKYECSFTETVEPEENFLACEVADDCFKFKGSICPTTNGGSEMCVDKDYVQAYNSLIEEKAGLTLEMECPAVDLTTNRTCECIENRCVLTVI